MHLIIKIKKVLNNKQGRKGKYMKTAKKEEMGTNLVLLSPDVAAAFPDDASVNEALRSLLKIARESTSRTRRSTVSRLAGRSR